MRNSIDLLKEVGAVLVRTKRHNVWRLPNGSTVIMSQSPSDFRAEANRVREIRHKMGMVDAAPKLTAGKRRERKEQVPAGRKLPSRPLPRSTKPSTFKGKLAHAVNRARLSVKAGDSKKVKEVTK